MSTILDLHTHSEASEDSRAPVEAYLNWIKLRATERPVDGIVLTEHRQFNRDADYRALEDKFGIVLEQSEFEGVVTVEQLVDIIEAKANAAQEGAAEAKA